MTAIAVASLALATLTVLVSLHTVSQLIRSHARERNLMLNQLMHLAGRTWQPPPNVEPVEPETVADYQYTTTNMPDFYDPVAE